MQAAVAIFTLIITILISSLQPVSAEPFPSTKTIQQILKSRGYNITVIDGVLGPQTAAAIRELQKKFGLKITGAVNEEVIAALNPAGERLLPTVMQLQKELKLRGYNIGIVDGLFGPSTSRALKSFQKNSGIAETGYINLGVAKALRPPASRSPPLITPADASKARNNDEKSKNKLLNSALNRTPREKTTRSEGSTTKEENVLHTPLVALKSPAITPDKTLAIKGPRITDRFATQKPPPKADTNILETDEQPITPTSPGPNKAPEEQSWQILDWLVLLLVLWGSWKLYQGVMWVWGMISRQVPVSRVQKASPEQGSGIDIPIVVQGTNDSEAKYFIEDEPDLTAALEAENTPGKSDQNVGPVEVKGAGGLVTFKLDLSPQPDQVARERPPIIEEVTRPRLSIFGRARKNCWVAKGVPVKIARIEITNGMLYVGTNLPAQRGYSGQDNCLINPKLKIARNSYGVDNEYMPYWPSYSDISPKNRRQYLEWLAAGAKAPDAYIGYVFLYFYGLERRLFLDLDTDDRREIITEIKRLLGIYGENHSVSRYLKEALSFADIILEKPPSLPLLQITDSYNLELPLGIKIYLGEKLRESSTLSVDDMLVWFVNHPERALRTPATRLEGEFLALMKVRLAEKYPDGIKVRKPRKKISLQYEASSRTFSVNLSKLIGDIPDVSGLSAPISKTQSIADDVMDELDKLSRYLGRNPDLVGSLKAASLLPAELVAEFGGDAARLLQSWLQEQYTAYKGIVTLSELAQRATDHDGMKITKALFTETEKLMTTLGWNMVPSANELISAARPEIKVLLLPAEFGGNALDTPSVDFKLALFELTLGSFIAHTDTGIRSIEMEHLVKRLGSMNAIGKAERDRLHCCLQWLAVQQADIAALMRKLKKLDTDSQISFANLAVAIAAADGVIAHQEVKALESIYKAMGLDKKELFSNLHSMAGRSDVVPTGGSSNGDGSVRLDKDRIAATLHDTAKASNLLASIFVEDEIEPEDSVDELGELPKDSVALFNELDNAHAQLLQELLGKEEWPRDEYERLAASFKLMPDGAMEILNEWAYEKFDDAIIEDEDPVFIHMNIIQEERQYE